MPRRAALLLLLLPTLVSCTSARLVGRDLQAVARAPAREWKKVAAGTAVVGAALLLDDELARAARNNDAHVLDETARLVEPFGGGHSDKVMAGFLLYGVAAKNQRAKDAAFDAFVSSMIASKGITPALKAVVHRRRPNGGDDAFASNHATQAFAVASVIAAHYGGERPWVRWLAYGVATGVGAARIHHDAHWTSDVLAGAGIGALVGHTVVRTNREARAQWRVTATRNGALVQLTW